MSATMTISLSDPTLLRQQCYVDGAWIAADAGGTVDVTNPATGAVIASVHFTSRMSFRLLGQAIVTSPAPARAAAVAQSVAAPVLPSDPAITRT